MKKLLNYKQFKLNENLANFGEFNEENAEKLSDKIGLKTSIKHKAIYDWLIKNYEQDNPYFKELRNNNYDNIINNVFKQLKLNQLEVLFLKELQGIDNPSKIIGNDISPLTLSWLFKIICNTGSTELFEFARKTFKQNNEGYPDFALTCMMILKAKQEFTVEKVRHEDKLSKYLKDVNTLTNYLDVETSVKKTLSKNDTLTGYVKNLQKIQKQKAEKHKKTETGKGYKDEHGPGVPNHTFS